MRELLAGLNQSQREAVTATEGFIRVIAGAGSGKTRALANRFAYLVNEIGIMPGNILCVTFTNKSAHEMKQRIRLLTGDNDTGYISTFHSFCVSVLQEDINAVQYPKSFLVLDNSDIDTMLRIIYEERGLTLRHMTFARARDMIEIRKVFKEPEYYEAMIELPLDKLHQKYLDAVEAEDIIFYGYLYQEKKCFGLDYNDLIKFVLYIFTTDEKIRLKWQQRLEYIMIDEYQDIDELQYRLMKVLCTWHKNLFIVGDPDQTIYTWRGASVRYLLDFGQEFPNVRTIMMMHNYRSTPQILAAANSLIDKNRQRIKKDLTATLSGGVPVIYHHARTSKEGAEWMAARIKELAGQGVELGDIAILYRAHYVSRTLEEVFLKADLPYRIYSGVQFFSRMEIKDALSYLRLIVYKDDLSLRRIVNVPKRSIGERRIKFLQEYAQQNQCSLYQALQRSIENEIFKSTRAARFL
ncbi:MAG: UvrD-helicase domain-containing protein, partial [Syntrophomonadaceae bacterium]|nr:UvrD-helicase domain-containing protein [Syntrophomonadaceae bacterium]